jgi:D-hydroxyproline dehydrogenase subunit alpha
MSAALAAAEAGAEVCLVDDREALGGSPGTPGWGGAEARATRAPVAAMATRRMETRLGTVVWGLWDRLVALVTADGVSETLEADRLIVASGATERPVVFPGWILPGVATASEVPSWVRAPGTAAGRRVLVAGSGPRLPALAVGLHRAGARVVLVAEATPRLSPRVLARLALTAGGDPAMLLGGRARAYLRRHRVPVLRSHVIARALGDDRVEQAVVTGVDADWRPRPGTERTIDVDLVCLAYGLVPSTELTLLAGAHHVDDEARGGRVPVHDEWMRTTTAGLFVAGDCAGVADSWEAVGQGRLAGIAAAMDVGRLAQDQAERLAAPVRRRLGRRRRLRDALDRAYAPGPGFYELARPDTVVCRCEGVSAGQVLACLEDGARDLSSIKAVTRAGMGLCQARWCARQLTALVARHLAMPVGEVPGFTPRPPARPVLLGAIAAERAERPRAPVID